MTIVETPARQTERPMHEGFSSLRLRAQDVMTAPVVTVRPDTALKDVAAFMVTHHISGVPVVAADGELVGIVTEADLLEKESRTGRSGGTFFSKVAAQLGGGREHRRKLEGVLAADVMSAPVITVEEATPIREVASLMVRRKINRVPVMRRGRLVGIVSRNDVMRVFVRPDEETAQAVRDGLLHKLWIDITPLNVEVKNGVVYLDGRVESYWDKDLAERWVAAIEGVLRVESSLTYEFDDRKAVTIGDGRRPR